MTISFGTDGIRGIALQEGGLTTDLARSLGRAASAVLPGERWLIGSDGRASGAALVGALAEGLAPKAATDLGLLPTPAIAFYSQQQNLPAAIVSASHNPWTDNGIKLLAAGGRKLTDEIEVAVSVRMTAVPPASPVWAAGEADGAYERHLVESVSAGIRGMHVVVDCANGAASDIAPRVLRTLGAEVTVLNARPTGTNINDGCGSTHPSVLRAAVLHHRADAGLAFDGDADRVVAVDHTGEVIDGDRILAVCAPDMRRRGLLRNNTVVVTVMSNLGLRLALRERGIDLVETAVGDRYVLDAMDKGGYALGGEQSGHVIFADLATTGDGLLTGLQLLDAVARDGRRLAEVAAEAMTRLPQVLRNVRVPDPGRLADAARVWEMVKAAEQELGSHGRVLLRPSGTEPLVRVMAEAPTAEQAETIADRIAAAVAADLGK